MLSLKQIENRLRKHYDTYWGNRVTDEWWGGNIPDNVWKFDRRGKTIILTCDPETGKVTEEVKELRDSGRDICINTTDPDGCDNGDKYGIIPSVVKTYIPTRWLARNVASFKYEEDVDNGKVYPLLCVEYKPEKKRRR